MMVTVSKTSSICPTSIFQKSCRGVNKLTLTTGVYGRRFMLPQIGKAIKLVAEIGAGVAANIAIENASLSKNQSAEERAVARAEALARRIENEPPSPSTKPTTDPFLPSTIEHFDIEYWTFTDVLAILFVTIVFCYFVFRVFLSYEIHKQGPSFVKKFVSDARSDFDRLLGSIGAGALSPAIAHAIQDFSSRREINRPADSDPFGYGSQLYDFIASSDFNTVFSCVFVTFVWLIIFLVQKSGRH